MTKEELLSNLCSNDKRNPDHISYDDNEDYDPNCACDNCFQGKHKLAEYTLKLIDDQCLSCRKLHLLEKEITTHT